jgi:hypothetical protein
MNADEIVRRLAQLAIASLAFEHLHLRLPLLRNVIHGRDPLAITGDRGADLHQSRAAIFENDSGVARSSAGRVITSMFGNDELRKSTAA